MTEQTSPNPPYATPNSPVHGVLAEFDDVTTLTRACEAVRDAGFSRWDAYTPFAVHGLDAAMGVRRTRLPWAVVAMGICGMAFAIWLQCWTMGVDYKFVISGKPLMSLPAFVPVTFELTVLFSVFTIFFGSLALNKLPDFFHPLNLAPQFRRVTDDRFFIYVEAKDPKFDAQKVQALLQSHKPLSLEVQRYASEGIHTHFPSGTVGVVAILGVLSLVPFALFAKARQSTSLLPRIHANPPAPIKDDMDKQFKFKPQAVNWFFPDGRAMRNYPAGAVADEDPVDETPFLSGRPVHALAAAPTHPQVPTALEVVKPSHAGKKHKELATPPLAPNVAGTTEYVQQIPAEVNLTATTLKRGQQRFNIYCSTCHGYSGHGDGAVARHAEALQEGTWVAPTNLHEERVRKLAVGDIFNTITHGVRNMPGYGHLVEPEDRWLIVAYIKALQRSQHAAIADVPSEARPALQ